MNPVIPTFPRLSGLARSRARAGRGGVVVWLGMILLALAFLPSLLGSLVAFFGCSGNHDVRCEIDERGAFVLTLHHPEATSGPRHHNLLETLMVGTDEAGRGDHHLRWGGGTAGPDPEEMAAEHPGDTGALSVKTAEPVPAPEFREESHVLARVTVSPRDGPPSWRGGVMRI